MSAGWQYLSDCCFILRGICLIMALTALTLPLLIISDMDNKKWRKVIIYAGIAMIIVGALGFIFIPSPEVFKALAKGH